MHRTACLLLLAAAFPPAFAQQAADPAPPAMRPAPDGLSLGVAAIGSDGVMLGEDARQFVVPTIGYEGERFFFRGIAGGAHLATWGRVQLDATLSARLDGWDADDLDAAALAARGIDRASLQDRDQGVDAGLALVWQTGAGVFGADVKADVSGASDGVAARVEYGLPIPFAGGMLTPTVQVQRWSARLADYYYGTLDAEEAAGVPRYRPGAAVVPGAGVRWLRPFARHWVLVAGVQVDALDDAITDSPLVDDDADVQRAVFLNVSRRFGAD